MASTAPRSDSKPLAPGDDRMANAALKSAVDEVYTYKGRKFTVHPAAHVFPHMGGDVFEKFVDDVRLHGVRHPVQVAGDVIIDGRTRMRAALKAGKDLVFEELGANVDPYAFVISQNMQRRHMTPTQCAVVARTLAAVARIQAGHQAKLVPKDEPGAGSDGGAAGSNGKSAAGSADPDRPTLLAPGQNVGDGNLPERPSAAPEPAPAGSKGKGGRPRTPPPSGPSSESLQVGEGREFAANPAPASIVVKPPPVDPISPEEAAAALGVSERSVQRADRVARQAPEVVEALADGSATLKDADSPEVMGASPEVRTKAVEAVRKGEAPTLRAAVERENKKSGTPSPAAAGGKKRRSGSAARKPSGEMDNDLDLPALGGLPGAGSGEGAPSAGGQPLFRPSTAGASRDEEPAVEIYSPRELISVVRTVLQGIDLDPCSSEEAQAGIEAREFYDRERDGLSLPWKGKTYVFPPLNAVSGFVGKFVTEIIGSGVNQAAFLAPSGTGAEWAQRLLSVPSLSAVVIRKGDDGLVTAPPKPGEKPGFWRPPQGLTLYLYGVPATNEVADVLASWGFPFRRAAVV